MAEFVRGGPSVSNNAKIEHSSKGGSPSTGSEDGGTNELLNVDSEFDPFLENIPDDLQDTEEPDNASSTLLTAPPENQWYHGRLDRFTAEERLWDANKMGSYLVRESDRKPGSYVLSYLGRTGINHFRITAVCGDYYIGGRQFNSLSDLVAYYTHCSDLLKRERLIHPIPPPEPVNDKKRIVAILPYTKMPDTDELSFQKGDIFFVHNDMGDGWLWVTAHRTGEQGLIFRELVEDLDDSIDPNTVFSWFHPNVTKSEAVDMLVKAGPGSFLVHDSVFDRPHCFQLVERALPCLATITYLAAPNSESAQDWINALKPLCVSQLSRAPKVARLRELRSLHLHILDAHRLPYKLVPNPFIIVALNNVKVARTKVKTCLHPLWDEEFLLEDVPPDVMTFSLTLYNKGKRSKDTEVAEVSVELANLLNGEEMDEWYPFSGITPIGEWGALRLRIRYRHDLAMPPEEYSPLQQLLLDPELHVVRALADVCHSDRVPLASSLLKIFRYERKEADLLRSLNQAEVDKEDETPTLFRAASLTTTLMDLYMKSICTSFLKAALRDTIIKLIESKQSCELNPNKMDSPEDACSNAEFLLQVLDEVTLSIFTSPDACPKTLRYICGCLQRAVVAKWPHERLVRTRVVSGFIFLRLLCPAILNPRSFNLISESPPPAAARSLVMVAKCLQNLANLVEFGGKEPYMEVVNPFILKNKERMVVFLDQLSSVTEKPESEGVEYRNKNISDTARDLATLHHICVSHLRELQVLSKTQPTIKQLVTVTEMLSKHKQKYMEMIR
ncbi:ras GTPase-activating protein 1 isoform X2 [Microplitis demolitor]|uniref:ras GTPase-activating protein 1 isoform X2 n=1 Tax=Microplitis demolitor TaxID=69319 RepID=UPI0006D51767|nr:ras GTPase-activating protein 1 isoform X2 [Microplitis demolitor]